MASYLIVISMTVGAAKATVEKNVEKMKVRECRICILELMKRTLVRDSRIDNTNWNEGVKKVALLQYLWIRCFLERGLVVRRGVDYMGTQEVQIITIHSID